MSFSRRKFVKGAGAGGFAAAVAMLLPEAARASVAGQVAPAAQDRRAIAMVRSDKGVARVLTKYPRHNVIWDAATVGGEDSLAWVTVLANIENQQRAFHLRALLDLDAEKVLLIQHTSLVGDGSDTHVRLYFGEDELVWSGRFNADAQLIADAGYPSVEELENTMQPAASCASVIGTVCTLAAQGNSIIACAIFAASGFGAIGCALLLWLISWYGCRRATQIICG